MKLLQGILDARVGLDFLFQFLQILVVRKPFQIELGCPSGVTNEWSKSTVTRGEEAFEGSISSTFFPESSGEEAIPEGAWMLQRGKHRGVNIDRDYSGVRF